MRVGAMSKEDIYTRHTREKWQDFYRQCFNMEVDFSDVKVPEYVNKHVNNYVNKYISNCVNDFGRIIFIAKGFTFAKIIEACCKYFRVFNTVCLDKEIVKEDGNTAKISYAIRVRNRQGADEEFANLSANKLRLKGIGGISLLERLVFELFYFIENKECFDRPNSGIVAPELCPYWRSQMHLDIYGSSTLCTSSRDSVGHVPCVSWEDDVVSIGWTPPDRPSPNLRVREIVWCFP